MTTTKLERLTKLWQKRLRLQDWTVQIELVDDFGADNQTGASRTTPKFLEAKVGIKSGLDDKTTELVLVHELMHVRFPSFIPNEDSILGHEFEIGVEMVARALVEAYA